MHLRAFDGDDAGIDFVDLLMIDLHGALRRVSLPRASATDRRLAQGIGFDGSNLGYAKTADSDMVAVPDLATAFVREQAGRNVLCALCDVVRTDGEPFDQYPRAVARRALEVLREAGVAEDAQMLVELEFHVFDRVSYGSGIDHARFEVESAEGLGPTFAELPRFGVDRGYHRLAPEDRHEDLRHEVVAALGAIGVPVKYHHHEVGAAQLEIELDLLSLPQAADAAVLAKWIVRSVAAARGQHATFMPKPMPGTAGNGMHVHQLLERDGRTLFAGDGLHGLSDLALAYGAGLLEHSLSGSLLAFTNPSTNSYRRLVPGFEAPVAATLAEGSREAAVRVPGYLARHERRFEYRTGDATANLHYALAAMLLAGLDGVQRDADPVALGFVGPGEARSFPLSLHAALDGLEADRAYLAPAFPAGLLDQWIATKRREAKRVAEAPTPQEYELYFHA